MVSHMKRHIIYVCMLMAGLAAQPLQAQSDRSFEIAKNLEIFSSVYKQLNLNYVDDVDPGKAIKVAIDAMLASFDPYTNYFPESDIEDVKLQLLGEYGGVGAIITQRGDSVYISEPYKGLPADEAGLKAGDRIVAVNGESTQGKKVPDVSSAMRGQAGTTVTLRVEREGKEFERTLIRREIKLPNVPYSGFVGDNGDVGYIKLDEFTNDAAKNVREAFVRLKKERPTMRGVILDLRGNGGGLMNEAVDIVNIWVPRGTLVVETKGKVASKNIKSFTRLQPEDTEIPLAVLIDGSSASASEIVSGSLQDLDRAVVPDSLKTAFKTKAGRTVYDGFGIEPDIEIEPEYMSNLAIALMQKLLIFDYATEFYRKHQDIPSPETFEITDEIYADFCRYLKEKNLTYNTVTERFIKDLREVAKQEKYDDAIEQQLKEMESRLATEKESDLQKHRDEVSDMLKAEILTRYYYDQGRLKGALKSDKVVLRAVEELGKTSNEKK